MKKLLHLIFLSALAFSFTPMKAADAITDVKELYGTWHFTAQSSNVNSAYSSAFSADCDVTIKESPVSGACTISGFAGAKRDLTATLEGSTLVVKPNSNNEGSDWYITEDNTQLYYSNETGANPFGEIQQSLSFVFIIGNGGTSLTTTDFTLVALSNNSGDPSQATATTVAKFTNCAMTLTKKADTEGKNATDMSGNWHFEAGRFIEVDKNKDTIKNDAQYNEKSEFPITFDMKLTATNNEFTAYSAEITFPGYEPVTIENVTFDDDETMEFPINDTYIDAEQKIAFAIFDWTLNACVRTGYFAFTKTDKNTLELKGDPYFAILKDETMIQYYGGGTATKEVEGIDFSGTYTVTTPEVEYAAPRLTEYTIPETWQMKIEKAESGNGYGYVITTFLNENLAGSPILANVSAEDPNVLEISTYSSQMGAASVVPIGELGSGKFLAIANGPEEQKEGDIITFTYNIEEETYALSSYALIYTDSNPDAESGNWELFVSGESSAVKGSSGVKEAEADAAPAQSCVYTVNGSIVIAGEPTRVEVYSLTGACLYDGITNEIGGLKRGYYLVRTGKNVNKVILK